MIYFTNRNYTPKKKLKFTVSRDARKKLLHFMPIEHHNNMYEIFFSIRFAVTKHFAIHMLRKSNK